MPIINIQQVIGAQRCLVLVKSTSNRYSHEKTWYHQMEQEVPVKVLVLELIYEINLSNDELLSFPFDARDRTRAHQHMCHQFDACKKQHLPFLFMTHLRWAKSL